MSLSSPVFANFRSPVLSGGVSLPQPPMGPPSEVQLGKSGPIGGKFSPNRGRISPACAARAMGWLRQQHPFKPAEEIEVATGGMVSADTAKKWLAGQSAPSFLAMCALIVAYGPEFLSATLDHPPEWLSTAARAEKIADVAVRRARLEAELAEIEAGQ